jgi:tetratricopeptide (TPR) repeat protein
MLDAPSMTKKNTKKRGFLRTQAAPLMVCACLILMVFGVFGQTVWYGLINLDDPQQVLDVHVSRGLSLSGLNWAFTHSQERWAPLAVISRQFDWQIFGSWAGGYHLTNLLIHAASAVLLFLAFRSMTGRLWRSAFVAAIFAIHPLKVEPVVWISARSELLCGLFFLLAILAYARYARGPRFGRYLLVTLVFFLGLLSKPMIVTLPLVLLLIDYWPLQRMRLGSGWSLSRLLVEKFPLLFLSGLSVILTDLFQASRGEVAWAPLPLLTRLIEVPVAYCFYIIKEVCPWGLSLYYPLFNKPFPALIDVACLSLLVFLTWCVFYLNDGWRGSRPYLITGWLWFLVMLLPVVDLAAIDCFSPADRYSYLPMIGTSLVVVWSLGDWFSKQGISMFWRGSAYGACGVILLGLMILSAWQAACWADNSRLWAHALECTKENPLAELEFGWARLDEGKNREALESFQKAERINPSYANAYFSSGSALQRLGRLEESAAEYRSGLKARPGDAAAHDQLADTLVLLGQTEEAILEYNEALRIDPTNLKVVSKLVRVFINSGRVAEAIALLESTLHASSDAVNLQNDLAWILATTPEENLRNGKKALSLALQANKESGGQDASLLDTLAAAYAETGDFANALEAARHALEIAEASGNKELSRDLKKEISLYEAGRPLRAP